MVLRFKKIAAVVVVVFGLTILTGLAVMLAADVVAVVQHADDY